MKTPGFISIATLGDKDLAEQLIPLGHNLLGQVRLRNTSIARKRIEFPGGYVEAFVCGKFSSITIVATNVGAPVTAAEIITPSVLRILSGASQDATRTVGYSSPGGPPPSVQLYSFRPTTTTAKLLSKGASSGTFSPISSLTNRVDSSMGFPDPNSTKVQVGVLNAGMYSGKMCQLIQLLLGYNFSGPQNSEILSTENGLAIQYDYQFARTHGVLTDNVGGLWLIEISQANGVLGMKLGVLKHTTVVADSFAVSQAKAIFKGIPDGKGFPKGAALTAAIAKGTVFQMLPASALAGFYGYSSYSSALGWSFSQTGDEAHNTCWERIAATAPLTDRSIPWNQDQAWGMHYKISLSVTIGDKGHVDATASISQVSRARYYGGYTQGPKFMFYDPINGYTFAPLASVADMTDNSLLVINSNGDHAVHPNPMDYVTVGPSVTIFAGHQPDGTLYLVKYLYDATRRTNGRVAISNLDTENYGNVCDLSVGDYSENLVSTPGEYIRYTPVTITKTLTGSMSQNSVYGGPGVGWIIYPQIPLNWSTSFQGEAASYTRICGTFPAQSCLQAKNFRDSVSLGTIFAPFEEVDSIYGTDTWITGQQDTSAPSWHAPDGWSGGGTYSYSGGRAGPSSTVVTSSTVYTFKTHSVPYDVVVLTPYLNTPSDLPDALEVDANFIGSTSYCMTLHFNENDRWQTFQAGSMFDGVPPNAKHTYSFVGAIP